MIASKYVMTDRQKVIERAGGNKKNDCRYERQDNHLMMFFDLVGQCGHDNILLNKKADVVDLCRWSVSALIYVKQPREGRAQYAVACKNQGRTRSHRVQMFAPVSYTHLTLPTTPYV